MSAVIDWIKMNMKEGANIAEVEELIGSDSLSAIGSKEKALELLYTNKLLKAAFDSEISKKIENHDSRFKEEKLPSLLEQEREKLRAELNPEETPEQKEIRELREMVQRAQAKEKRAELESSLRGKAKELNYDPERAARFAILGEDAEKFLTDEASFYQKALDAQREQLINGTLGGKQPPGGDSLPTEITLDKIDGMSIAEIEAAYK
jgi:hypothetical protein